MRRTANPTRKIPNRVKSRPEMAQIFHRSTNHLSKASIFGGVFIVVAIIFIFAKLSTGPYVNDQNVVRQQPIPFSHEHHVRGLGIDCRYCHTSVEESSYAGIPSAKTCMSCHSQVWTNAEVLEPLRQAYRTGQPIHWTRVHNLPQYVYFNHSIHVAKGVACTTCHGPVNQMPLMYQQNTLHMTWCLECHRHPEKFVGPKEAVFQTEESARGEAFVKKYHVKNAQKLSDCYACHR